MKKHYKLPAGQLSLFIALMMSFFQFTASAQIWTGQVNSDWHNPLNWSPNAAPTAGGTYTVPQFLYGGAAPVISSPEVVNYTIQNLNNITFAANVTNQGKIINFSIGCLTNNSGTLFKNIGEVLYDNDGKFINNGTFENVGIVDNAGIAVFTNATGATLNNSGTITNFGNITNNGTVKNTGTIFNTAVFCNNGLVTNNNFLKNETVGNFQNKASGTFNNYGTVEIGGLFTNDGTFLNEASLKINSSGRLVNNNLLTNNRDMTNSGIFDNNKRFNNYHFIFNEFGGIINNYDRIVNTGTIEIFACTFLYQYSSRSIDGNVWNLGIIYQLGANVNSNDMGGIKLFSLNSTPKPTARCKDTTVQLDANGNGSIAPADVDNGSSADYCQTGGFEVSPKSFNCSHVGANTVTLTVRDYYGNSSSCTANVTVLSSTACQSQPPSVEICTYTQGFYGNTGGKKFGMTTLQIIQNALKDQNGNNKPIVLGTGDRTLTIPLSAAACVIELLPGGGTPSVMPKKNVTLGTNCNPSPIPLSSGKIDNILLSQTLTLTINVRNDSDLPPLPLANVCVAMPASVTAALGSNAKVADLLAYANRALGGQVNTDKLSDINKAVSSINEYFDDCKMACVGNRSSSSDILTLQSFRTGMDVTLIWITNTEVRNEYFVIERSGDGINYEPIMQVESHSFTSGHEQYTMTDHYPLTGKNFYRVKQVYLDSEFTYSNRADIRFGFDATSVTVYPNPVQDEVYLNLKEYAGAAGTIVIVNNLGQHLQQTFIEEIPVEPVHMELQNIMDGVYFIHVTVEGRRPFSRKIIVNKY